MNTQPPPGYVIYNGPSRIDGQQIVAILTGLRKSKNRKTGNVLQVYILRADTRPSQARKENKDVSICGDCPHRINKSCYVNLAKAPRAVHAAWLRGVYPDDLQAAAQAATDRHVRLGAYGDPYAVPVWVWRELLHLAAGWLGYTHQWRQPDAGPYMQWCMASADSCTDRVDALDMGYRTFRVRRADEALMPGEFVCPASDEGGKRVQCDTCKACDGTGRRGAAQGSPVIIVHGAMKKYF